MFSSCRETENSAKALAENAEMWHNSIIYTLGKQKGESDVHTIGYVLLWFAIPLLMVLGVDILVVKRLEKRRNRAAEKAVENSKSSSEA